MCATARRDVLRRYATGLPAVPQDYIVEVDPSRFMPTIRPMRPGPSTTWVALSAYNGCRHIGDHADIGMITWSGRYDRFRSGNETGCSLRARSAHSASASSRVCS